MATRKPVGQLLVERGALSPEALQRALAMGSGGLRLCSRLLEMGACDEGDLVSALAERLGVPGVDLGRSVIALATLALVPRQVAEADLILPLSTRGERLHLAMASPDVAARTVDEVRFVTGLQVSPYVAVVGALQRAIAQAYDARARGGAVWRGAAAPAGAEERIAAAIPRDTRPLETGEEALVGEAEVEIEVAAADEALPGAPPRVLVVDDEREIRLLVQRALEKNGYAVETAADGAEALERIAAAPPDLVLLDAMLPKIHGFEVCRRVKSARATRDVPVVLMTAVYRGWRFAQDAREAYGACDYLEKPFHLEDLLRRVARALRQGDPRGGGNRTAAEPHYRRGRELLLAGRAEDASRSLEQALALDPFLAEAQFELARSFRARGDHFSAMTAFEKAVELKPDYLAALRALASLYTESGFRRKACGTLERALQATADAGVREQIRQDLLKLL